ncbi:MAG TPA: glycogen debranching N-terminal domain-containing protein [Caulobacteraceae bacterium]|jgi:glycogen debranching enzyme|nr:glycogen debranching N-terminal domain-containing protein [Caulobacteraceae bacterium]
MNLEITVGPEQLVIHQGHSILLTDRDGQAPWPTNRGLYFLDTRMVSAWLVFANGIPWDLLSSAAITHFASRIYLTNRRILTEDGEIPGRCLSFEVGRTIGVGLHEDFDITNRHSKRVRFNLEVLIRSDFADLFEVKTGEIVRRGHIHSEWSRARSELRAVYRNQDFRRELVVRVRRNGHVPVYANGRLSFDVDLEPGASWHACLLYEFHDGRKRYAAPRSCIDEHGETSAGRQAESWSDRVLKIQTSNEEVYRLYRQAVEDIASLRLPTDETGPHEFVPAAGVPWFVALFGRDTLITSLQAAMSYSRFARATLTALGAWQAKARDDERDAEPGKIMHELRLGELAHFKLIPHTPYYGTADATPLYLILLHHTWRCLGDLDLVKQHLETAEGCLSWIDNYGDRDGDGFQEYQTRSSHGYENQSWKDAGEAIVYPDGTLVKGPKALCELQGYVYDAWRRMAEVFEALGKPDRARMLNEKAELLYRRFNEAFWDEESGFYALALDGDKKPVLSVASNPGHLLWSGIVPPERAERVVRRLMAPDMWSGWGIRTLSSDHPAYNPMAYQTGSVWPHDNGLIALGFRRYGFAAEAARIARDISGAVSFFTLHQAPELYAGIHRSATNFPVQYLGANAPQAWAAGSAFHLMQSLLGFQPDAPAGCVWFDPALPDWLPDITLIGLHFMGGRHDIRFWRDGAETRWEVLKGDKRRFAHRSYDSKNRLHSAMPAPT